MFMYLAWWKKPQNVSEGIDVPLSPFLGTMIGSPFIRDFQRKCRMTRPREPRTRPANWQNFVPENKSGVRVEESVADIQYVQDDGVGENISRRIRRNGAVMLLPGQSLEGSPYVYWP
jgi:hypothetical protein